MNDHADPTSSGGEARRARLVVMQRAARNLKLYRVRGSSAGCSLSVRGAQHSISTDVPAREGGCDSAATPLETLLGALAGCTAATAAFAAPRLALRVARLDFDLRAERDAAAPAALPVTAEPPAPPRPSRVWGEVLVTTDGGEEAVARLGEVVHRRCPVADMLVASGCVVDLVWKVNVDGLDCTVPL